MATDDKEAPLRKAPAKPREKVFTLLAKGLLPLPIQQRLTGLYVRYRDQGGEELIVVSLPYALMSLTPGASAETSEQTKGIIERVDTVEVFYQAPGTTEAQVTA